MRMKIDSLVVKKWHAKFYIKSRIVNKMFSSVFDDRKNTSVSMLANIWNFFKRFKLEKFLFVDALHFVFKYA